MPTPFMPADGGSPFSPPVTTTAIGAQPLDSDLTAIAALTTTAHGRGLLDDANGAASRTSISAISGITETTDAWIPIPADGFTATSGTFTKTYQGTGVFRVRRTAAAASHVIAVEIPGTLLRTTSGKGTKAVSFRMQYKIATEVADDVTAAVYTVPMPADTAAPSGTLLTTTYDAGHDTAGERGAIAEHTMTVTITGPAYLNAVEHLVFEVTVNDSTGGGAVVDLKILEMSLSTIPVDATA